MDGQSLSKRRIEYIDLFRAFGIVMMIMGHIGFGSLFDKWIHIFHMPMFFIISGYFWKDQPFVSMLKKKCKTLLIPYFVFGIFHLIIHFIRVGHIDAHGLYLFLWENTAEAGVPIAGALWFLTAMFFSEVIFWCVQRLRNSVSLVVAILIALVGMVCATFLPFRLPYAVDIGMVGVGFYLFGKLIRDRWNTLISLNIIISIIGFVVFSALGLVNGYVNLREGLYSIWPLFWINSVGITICLWNIFRIIFEKLKEKALMEKILEYIKGIGCDSIIYLCLNQLMILIVRHLIFFIPSSVVLILLFKQIVILILSLIGLYIAQQIIIKTKLKVLVGK